MSTTTAPAPARGRPPRPPATPPPRRRKALWIAIGGLVLLVVMPIVILAGAANPPACGTSSVGAGPGAINASGGTAPGGHFAAPLHLQPGSWYKIGATEYGPPGTGDYGSDPDPGQSDLATHPDSFAELSTLDSNPANPGGSGFTFADADALGNLPYGTNVRVHGPSGRELVLAKRDTGYGQGPGGQTGGVIYRMDIWNSVSPLLGVSKSPVSIELAPASGTAPTLGQTPQSTGPQPAGGCADGGGSQISGTLQLTKGPTAQILADGNATAPAGSPRPVKLAIAGANEIDNKPYPPVEEHYFDQYLGTPWPAYDCSGSASYVLWKAGLRGIYATDSTGLESYGASGPGKWITIFANGSHTWLAIAGRAFDTSWAGNPASWAPAGSGPRWRPDPTGNLADTLSYVVRHPTGAWNDPS